MLDDRTVTRTDHDTRHVRVWTPKSNRYGWTSYLGAEPGSSGVSPYAAAARREDLTGLPPAWIGVGTIDLFHDEDLEYARRLIEAGVPCALSIVPGAFHGFDALFQKTTVARRFWWDQAEALSSAVSRSRSPVRHRPAPTPFAERRSGTTVAAHASGAPGLGSEIDGTVGSSEFGATGSSGWGSASSSGPDRSGSSGAGTVGPDGDSGACDARSGTVGPGGFSLGAGISPGACGMSPGPPPAGS